MYIGGSYQQIGQCQLSADNLCILFAPLTAASDYWHCCIVLFVNAIH